MALCQSNWNDLLIALCNYCAGMEIYGLHGYCLPTENIFNQIVNRRHQRQKNKYAQIEKCLKCCISLSDERTSCNAAVDKLSLSKSCSYLLSK